MNLRLRQIFLHASAEALTKGLVVEKVKEESSTASRRTWLQNNALKGIICKILGVLDLCNSEILLLCMAVCVACFYSNLKLSSFPYLKKLFLDGALEFLFFAVEYFDP